jgi:hydroxymethylpyrimidine pyrophosphatase-like HAD family hydrolase
VARLGRDASTRDLEATAAREAVYAFSVLGLSRERLSPVYDELLHTPDASAILYREPAYGDYGLIVNPPGITKWTGVEAYCRRHDIDADEVMAVGDGLNDIPMLRHAGVAVAVHGGAPEAIAVAQHLIAPPTSGGWTEVIDLVGQY